MDYETHYVSLNYLLSILEDQVVGISKPKTYKLKVESLLLFHNAISKLFLDENFRAFTLSNRNYQNDPVYIIAKNLNHIKL